MDMTQAQTARSALSPPHDVLLYIDSEMKDLDFVNRSSVRSDKF
jgi:hypothetical protein